MDIVSIHSVSVFGLRLHADVVARDAHKMRHH